MNCCHGYPSTGGFRPYIAVQSSTTLNTEQAPLPSLGAQESGHTHFKMAVQFSADIPYRSREATAQFGLLTQRKMALTTPGGGASSGKPRGSRAKGIKL